MNIYLDLEDTVIDSWESQMFLEHKIQYIRKTIKKLSIDYNDSNINLILFSAAVIDSDDINEFETYIKDVLEDKLRIKFSEYFIFSNKNIFALAKQHNISVLNDDSIHDIFRNNIKEEVFNLWCKNTKGINVIFDDTVSNKIVNYKGDNIFSQPIRTDIFVKM